MTKVNSEYKGIARALVEVKNVYPKECSCTIDFLIAFVLLSSNLPYIKRTCFHCSKLRDLVESVSNCEADFEEEEEEPTFQINLMLPPQPKLTPQEKMVAYAQSLDPKYFLFFDTPK